MTPAADVELEQLASALATALASAWRQKTAPGGDPDRPRAAKLLTRESGVSHARA